MRHPATMLAFLLMTAGAVGSANAQEKPDQKSGIKFGLTGNLYLAPQNWPDIGQADDQKFGLGVGGMIGLGLKVDDMRVGVGPHMSYNVWTADYSQKSNSATRSVTFGMADVGLEGHAFFDNMGVYLGKGTSTMDGYMTLDNGDQFRYPGLDGEKFGYQNVGIGFLFRKMTLVVMHTSYDDAAVDASRLELRIGLGR